MYTVSVWNVIGNQLYTQLVSGSVAVYTISIARDRSNVQLRC